MKKTALLIAALVPSSSAFAYGYSYHDDGMAAFSVIMLLFGIAYMVLIIAIIVKFFKIASDVAQIRQHHDNKSSRNTKLTYLVAIGEKERAQKEAVRILVDILYPIYFDQSNEAKAETMNESIGPLIPKMKRLGLELPDYVLSGERFITYLNRITGNNVPGGIATGDNTATRLFRR